jgi:hypothetical protein
MLLLRGSINWKSPRLLDALLLVLLKIRNSPPVKNFGYRQK